MAAREAVTEAIEPLRRAKTIRSSNEAAVTLPTGDLPLPPADLAELFIVASVRDGEMFHVEHTRAAKCGRCWRHLPSVAEDGALCDRCAAVIGGAHVSSRRHHALGYGLAALVAALDQLVKWWMTGPLELELVRQITVLPIFNLTYLRNYGICDGPVPGRTATADSLAARRAHRRHCGRGRRMDLAGTRAG